MLKRELQQEVRTGLAVATEQSQTPEQSQTLAATDILHDYLDTLLQQIGDDDGFSFREQPSFECLLFELCSFKFLTPVSQLAAIVNLDSNIVSAIFDRGHLRMLRVGGDLWRTADTASLLNLGTQPAYRMALCVEATGWALPVDNVIGTEVIQAGEVRWRDTSVSMPWYPGIHLVRMCRIFDLYRLIDSRLADITEQEMDLA